MRNLRLALPTNTGAAASMPGARPTGGMGMIVEWKRLRVRADLRERFVAVDEQVWTLGLAREAGFAGK
jgi:hypothetical protein